MAHPLQPNSPGLASRAWAKPFPPPDLEVPAGFDGLQALALQGRWREVVQRCRGTTATATGAALSVGAFHVLALMKLKMDQEAAAELAKLGSLEDPAFSASKAQGGASLVPFALRVLRAELPWRLGQQQESIDRLYALLDWCMAAQQRAAAAVVVAASTAGAAAVLLWQRRHRGVLLQLVNKHCRLRQYQPALLLLDRLLQRDVTDAEAWVQAGLVQLMLGDLTAAQQTLQRAEQLLLLAQAGGSSVAGGGGVDGQQQQQQQQLVVHRNRGLLAFLQQDYEGASKELAAALALDPSDATAHNNAALCKMYSCQLSEAVQALEQAFMAAPAAMMLESVVTNLAGMYELGASPAVLEGKRRMAGWVAAAAPDDFDLAATKTVGA